MSWKNLLLKLRDRGMTQAPELAIGDGAMGFWAAIDEVFPQTRHQRCWVHRTANVLDVLPKSKQTEAKTMIHEIYRAESKSEAEKAFKRFIDTFDAKYPGAVKKLLKTKESTMTFYDFPAEHWSHTRSTNPIESMFGAPRGAYYSPFWGRLAGESPARKALRPCASGIESWVHGGDKMD